MTDDAGQGRARAEALALKLLGHRPRSEQQVRERLAGAGFEEAVRDAVLKRLRELGYVNDREYARARAEALAKSGRMAPARIEQKLLAEGIAASLAEEAAGSLERGSERELAARALAGRRPPVTAASPLPDRLRAARQLASRGFSEELVRELLRLDET